MLFILLLLLGFQESIFVIGMLIGKYPWDQYLWKGRGNTGLDNAEI